MQNIFVITSSASNSDLIDLINRKLEQVQSIADYLSLSEFNGALEAISDLIDDIKQLVDALCKQLKTV